MARKNWNQDYFKVGGSTVEDPDLTAKDRARVRGSAGPGAGRDRPPKAATARGAANRAPTRPTPPRRQPKAPAKPTPRAERIHRVRPAAPRRPTPPPAERFARVEPPRAEPPPRPAVVDDDVGAPREELPSAWLGVRAWAFALGTAAFSLPLTAARGAFDRLTKIRRGLEDRRSDLRDRARRFKEDWLAR